MSFSIWELIGAVVVAALGSTGLWSFIAARNKKDTAERKLLVGLAHDRIIFLGTKYIERGYITTDEYENLNEYLFEPYTDAGGNGSAKRVMEEVRKLPFYKTKSGGT